MRVLLSYSTASHVVTGKKESNCQWPTKLQLRPLFNIIHRLAKARWKFRSQLPIADWIFLLSSFIYQLEISNECSAPLGIAPRVSYCHWLGPNSVCCGISNCNWNSILMNLSPDLVPALTKAQWCSLFISAIPISFQIAYKKTRRRLKLWRALTEWGRTKCYKNLRVSPFTKDLLNETTFSQIHLAGQYL